MDRRARRAIAGALGLLALIGGSVGLTDSLDARLAGAWTTSEADCARLFQRRGGALTFRQPVDKFAQAAIIGPQTILALQLLPGPKRLPSERGHQGQRRLQRHDQLHDPDRPDQGQVHERDRLQPGRRSRPRHHLDQVRDVSGPFARAAPAVVASISRSRRNPERDREWGTRRAGAKEVEGRGGCALCSLGAPADRDAARPYALHPRQGAGSRGSHCP